MAIHGERIYRACPGRAVVEVTDLAGVVVDALAYEEAQGAAEFVDCNGDFYAPRRLRGIFGSGVCPRTASGERRRTAPRGAR